MKKIAVVLSGCGVFDGSEIHEAVTSLLSIEKCGATYQCFAPDIMVNNPTNHKTKSPSDSGYSVLEMSGRIARGDILALSEFNASDFDGIFFPGGMGAVKNLCDFAEKGIDCEVNSDVSSAVLAMHEQKKPIGAICIAPVLIAKILGKGSITIGAEPGLASAIEQMGAKHENKQVNEVCVDTENMLVTSPAYMLAQNITEVEQSAYNTVEKMIGMM